MEQAGFIVGIDFGSSKIIGLLGRKNEQGVISIIASESIPSNSCVKHGVIYNIDEAAGKIKKLLNLLENKVGKKIGKVYVSVAGKSLRAIEHVQSKVLSGGASVSYMMLDQMELMARMNKPEFFSNYSVVAPEIFLDGKLELEPVGKTAIQLEARYRLVVGRPNIKSNLLKSIVDKNQIDIAGFIVGPVATGAIILDEEDKNNGCALIDFGAGTTTVSVYKHGLLRYMSVIPFGGRTITKDVQDLGFIDTVAESYKIRYGRVGKEKAKQDKTVSDSDLNLKELNKVIQLRQEEIILNVLNQIKESGYGDQLDAGIVITGGASMLNGLADYLSEKSKLPVKRGVIKRLYVNNATDLLQNPSYSQCLGIMLFAKDNCEKIEIPVEIPPVQEEIPLPPVQEEIKEEEHKKKEEHKKPKNIFDFFGKIQNLGGTMFKDEN